MLISLVLILETVSSCAENGTAGTEGNTKGETGGETEGETGIVEKSNYTSAVERIYGEQKIKLRFGEDGKFRILVISDLHTSGEEVPAQTIENIKTVLEREKPDFVMLNGDNLWCCDTKEQIEALVEQFTGPFEEAGIPWAHVYGNHDSESSQIKKDGQQEIYESCEHCISKSGPEELYGVGNYVIPVFAYDSDEVKYNIWAIDSGESDPLFDQVAPVKSVFQGYENSYFGRVTTGQIVWYYETSKQIHDELGRKIPGIMCCHIPVQECYNAYVNASAIRHDGDKNEGISADELNTGLFAAVVERGDITAMAFGHDHLNDYMYNYCGVKLCACSTLTTEGYHDENHDGARVFDLYENGKIDTYMSYLK